MAKKTDNVVVLADHRNPAVKDTPDGCRSFRYRNSAAFTDAAKLLYALDTDPESGELVGEHCFELRYNNRSNRIEWKGGLTGEQNYLWHPATDGFISHIAEEIEQRHVYQGPNGAKTIPLHFSAESLGRAMLAITRKAEVDPFLDWLFRLTPTKGNPQVWDGVERIDTIFTTLFSAEDSALTREAARLVFLGSIDRARDPGSLIRTMPLLVGAQSIGKSAFFRNLFPPEHQASWFSDSYNIYESDTKQRIEATFGAVICEISEMAGLHKVSLERAKADLTRRVDIMRLPYAKSVSELPRRFMFVGTSNNLNVLPDDESGNDRFLVVKCEGSNGPVEPYLDANRTQIWAEAVGLYDAGARPLLPQALKAAQAKSNEEHRSRDFVLEDELPTIMGELIRPTLNTIMERLGMRAAKQADQRRVIAALRRIGCEDKRTNKGRYWAFIESDGVTAP